MTARLVIVYLLLFLCLTNNENVCDYCIHILQMLFAFIAAYVIFEGEILASN